MVDPKQLQKDNDSTAVVAADGELNLSLENVAQDHQQSPQFPTETKVGESSLNAASTVDIPQPSPGIELAYDVDHPEVDNNLHSSPCAGDKESLQSSACAKPNGSPDEAAQISTFQQEAHSGDASFKSNPLDDCGEVNVTVGLDDKQPSTSKYVGAENKDEHRGEEVSTMAKGDLSLLSEIKKELSISKLNDESEGHLRTPSKSFLLEPYSDEGYESGTEEEQAEFIRDVEAFYRDNYLEFKAPKFYKEELNLLKTCTTVSWTFRIFYEKALLEYEKHKMHNGELPFSDGLSMEATRSENQSGGSQALVSGRAPRRDAAARAMQGWHSQRLLGNGEVCQPIIKDKTLSSIPKIDKPLKANGLLKRKKPSSAERAVHVSPLKTMRTQADTVVTDVGPPAEWVKINVQRTNDCYEVYALVPGLLREEVHVQSDPAGRLVISGQPEQLENPWGVTPFKKVISLPSRIDPHQTTAVVTLHGQLFVRVPFEPSDV
ncbi:AT-rich interactive domain-containing protein 3 [Linum perenne]